MLFDLLDLLIELGVDELLLLGGFLAEDLAVEEVLVDFVELPGLVLPDELEALVEDLEFLEVLGHALVVEVEAAAGLGVVGFEVDVLVVLLLLHDVGGVAVLLLLAVALVQLHRLQVSVHLGLQSQLVLLELEDELVE